MPIWLRNFTYHQISDFKQKEQEAKLTDLVEDRLRNQKKLDLTVNLSPYKK